MMHPTRRRGLPALILPLLLLPRLGLAFDDARALRAGDWNERIRAVNELGKKRGAGESLSLALGDPDWQVRLSAVHWLGRRGGTERSRLEAVLGSEACPLVRMSALYWLAQAGREPEKFQALRSGEDMSGCDSWVGAIAEEYPRMPAKDRTELVVATPPDERGCFYARYRRPGKAACPDGAIVAGSGPSPVSVEFLAGNPSASGVALCCPPEKDLISGAGPVPARQDTQCHLMPERCPVGWVELESHPRRPARPDDMVWVNCCPQTGPFAALPPQKPEPIPACIPKERIDWLAFGLEGEGGCDLHDPNCPTKLPPEMAEPEIPAEPPEPPAPAARPAPPPRKTVRKTPEPLPDAKLVKVVDHDPGEPSASVTALMEGLRSASARERERAALALAGLGPRAAAAAAGLLPVLKSDPNPRVRGCAALALAGITQGGDAAIPSLQGALSDPHPGVRYLAAQALGKIGTPQALAAFLRYMRSETTRVARAERGSNPADDLP